MSNGNYDIVIDAIKKLQGSRCSTDAPGLSRMAGTFIEKAFNDKEISLDVASDLYDVVNKLNDKFRHECSCMTISQ